MLTSLTRTEQKWLSCLAGMASAGRAAAVALQGTPAARLPVGRGAGGDQTLEIDRACENAVLQELARCAPTPYSLVSEEAGIRDEPGSLHRVVLDPLDGSLNAKRGLNPFCVSIAVAEGQTLGDVRIAHVEEYLTPRSFTAVKGAGVLSAGSEPFSVAGHPDRPRPREDSVEVILLEAGRPDRHHFNYRDLAAIGGPGAAQDMRVRQIGSLALSLCYVAVGIADVLVAAVRSRAVDIAAGLLIVHEAGGGAAAFFGGNLPGQPLDLERRCAFIAWRAGLDGSEIMRRAQKLEDTLVASGVTGPATA